MRKLFVLSVLLIVTFRLTAFAQPIEVQDNYATSISALDTDTYNDSKLNVPVAVSADSVTATASLPGDSTQLPVTEDVKSNKFEPGDFIFDHIGDAYEWHICTVGSTHVTIPLPIILYSQKTGFHVFMSSRFHHNHGIYKNFRIEMQGQYDGKIVELDENGEIDADYPLPWEFSITKNAATAIIICLILCAITIPVAKKYKRNPLKAPSGLQNLLEYGIMFVRNDIVVPSLGERRSQRFMPFLLTLFFFILTANVLGLIPIFPGGANLTGNIAATMILATFTLLTVNLNGNKHYWIDVFNTPGVPWYMKLPIPIVPMVEVLGIFIKPIVLMIRLFANILAGHMIGMVFMSLIFIFSAIQGFLGYAIAPISLVFSLFMTALELLVALIQAYVFTILSAVYISMSTAEHS